VARRVVPPPPVIAEPEYEEDDLYYDEEQDVSLLRNPYVLAGLAVAGAIVLAVMVVFLFGQGGDSGAGGDSGSNSGVVAGNATAQPTVPAGAGLHVKSITTATVRSGPGLDFLELGLLRSNQDVQVVGRNQDATWFEIIFPPGSQLGGWVVQSALKLPADAADKVAVAQPTPVPRPSVLPTSAAPNITATPLPQGNADIAIRVASVCPVGQPIIAIVDNVGDVPLNDVSIRIVVSQGNDTKYDATYKVTMQPGQSVQPEITTTAVAPTMTVTVTLVGPLQDVDGSNNSSTCTVGSVSNSTGNNVPPPPVSTLTSPTPKPTANNR
jgi:uncharacterized protein YgiM (DUF1202 family)